MPNVTELSRSSKPIISSFDLVVFQEKSKEMYTAEKSKEAKQRKKCKPHVQKHCFRLFNLLFCNNL